MKLTDFQKYKHDTIGKFQTIKNLVEILDEENLSSEEHQEILKAIHESYLKMADASEEFLKSLNQ